MCEWRASRLVINGIPAGCWEVDEAKEIEELLCEREQKRLLWVSLGGQGV